MVLQVTTPHYQSNSKISLKFKGHRMSTCCTCKQILSCTWWHF